jgi:hypothetical protein
MSRRDGETDARGGGRRTDTLRVDSGGSIAVPRMAGIGATPPFPDALVRDQPVPLLRPADGTGRRSGVSAEPAARMRVWSTLDHHGAARRADLRLRLKMPLCAAVAAASLPTQLFTHRVAPKIQVSPAFHRPQVTRYLLICLSRQLADLLVLQVDHLYGRAILRPSATGRARRPPSGRR